MELLFHNQEWDSLRQSNTPRKLSLRRNFLWTLTGGIVYLGCQWGYLVVLAKIGTVEAVGQFALALAICAPVMMFARLNLRALQATDAKNEYIFGQYLGLTIVNSTLALLVIVAINWTAGYGGKTAWLLLAVGSAKYIENLSNIIFGLFQKHELMNLIGTSQLIKGPLSLLSLGLTFFLTESVFWATLSLAAAWGLILISYDIPNGLRVQKQSTLMTSDNLNRMNIDMVSFWPKWDERVFARLAWIALPLGIITLLVSLNVNIPRYFIERYGGDQGVHQLGIFASLSYLLVLGGRIVLSLGQAASPRLAKYYISGQKVAFRILVLKLVCAGIFLGLTGVLVSVLVGPQILTILYSTEFAEYAGVLNWLMLAATFVYISTFLENTLVAIRRIRVQILLLSVSIVCMIISCFTLIQVYGIWGAAWATGVAALVQLIGYLIVVGHALRSM